MTVQIMEQWTPERIKHLMELGKFSHLQLAIKLKVSEATVRDWLRTPRFIRLPIQKKLARIEQQLQARAENNPK